MKVLIGSENRAKVRPITKVFEEYFGIVDVEVMKVTSKVPEQPLNEEVMQGAANRVEELEKSNVSYDYAVACEGGLISMCGNWFNVQVVCIKAKNGKKEFGLSQAYPIPNSLIPRIEEIGLASVLDEVFNGKGGVRQLTRGLETREDHVREATIMALSGIRNW